MTTDESFEPSPIEGIVASPGNAMLAGGVPSASQAGCCRDVKGVESAHSCDAGGLAAVEGQARRTSSRRPELGTRLRGLAGALAC